jgi:hypothetical protein
LLTSDGRKFISSPVKKRETFDIIGVFRKTEPHSKRFFEALACGATVRRRFVTQLTFRIFKP